MKNKRTKYYNWVLAGVLALCCGCNDWLDVKPRTELQSDIIYANEKGFQNVMNGIYVQMAAKDLYGFNTSAYFTDLLAGLWYSNLLSSKEKSIAQYDFTNSEVEGVIDTIWSKYYTAIAHVNTLLEHLKETDVNFSYGNKELLMGEAYGLRAFLHLEVLRLFGPVPKEASDADIAIPYVTEFTKDPTKLISLTYGEVKKHIVEDLDEAEKYLQKDPFTLGTMSDLNNPNSVLSEYKPSDDWQYYRQTHFNVYAVDATRARFYQWIGESEQASLYARKVLDVKNPDGETAKFVLATEKNTYTASVPNLVMQCEHIFALSCSNHQTQIEGCFKSPVGGKPAILKQSPSYLNSIYEREVDDSRNKGGRYFEVDGQNAYCLKYLGSGIIKPLNMIPLIRLSEMYLILIENSPYAEAKEYFETYRIAKGMSSAIALKDDSDKSSRTEKEYRKEFFAEGQMFYYYKRKNITSWTIPSRVTVPANGFVVPKPSGQTVFE